MQELSGLDAAFLYLENEKLPMHIGSVMILEGSMTFDEYLHFMQSRLHAISRLTEKLATVPMNIDKPYWVTDPSFDIGNHLHQVALDKPGGWQELRTLASSIFSRLLDRDKPLWAFDFVTGLDSIAQVPKGSVAIISRVHHAAFDGQSGADLMGMLFDLSPTPRDLPAEEKTSASQEPGSLKMLGKGAASWLARPTKIPGLVWDTGKAILKSSYLSAVKGIKLPATPFRAPVTPFNGPVESQRRWDSAILDLQRVKALRQGAPDSTVNDVVLAICAGALRRYLLEKSLLPKEPLVAMVPVSIRTQDEKNTMGNQVSAIFVPLATDIEDPLRRLRSIQKNTLAAKIHQQAIDAKGLMELAEIIPFGLAGVASRYYCQHALAKKHKPFFNLVITNVPGPQVPLYMNGHKLLANMGTAPIYDNMGLIIPVCSYMGTLSLSPTSSDNLMPDLATFTRYIRESANEMEERLQRKLNAEAVIAKLLAE